MSFVHGMELTMKIYLNGEYAEKEDAVSVFDHGLLYGDGVFEGIACTMVAFSSWRRLEYSSRQSRRICP